MFQLLKDKIQGVINGIKALRVGARLDLDTIIRDLEMSLISNDVAVEASTYIVEQIKQKIQKLNTSFTPDLANIVSQNILQVIQDVLTSQKNRSIFLNNVHLTNKSPYIVLLLGLQGSGKTTTCVKLAHYLRSKFSVAVTCLDPYRPAADDQLRALSAQDPNIKYLPMTHKNPIKQAQSALRQAQDQQIQVLLLDTAGRINIDDKMLQELQQIESAVNPQEIILIADSLMGQNAVTIAKDFNQAVKLQNIILTRLDSDQKGGAVLSLRFALDAPIILTGYGEKISDIDEFDTQRIAKQIVGLGDISFLMKKIGQHKIEESKNILQKDSIDMNNLLQQFRQMKDVGGLRSVVENMPNVTSQQIQIIQQKAQAQNFTQGEAVILSMTKQERQHPQIINGSRKKRIACGSGTSILAVNRVLKRWQQSNQIIQKMKKGKNMNDSNLNHFSNNLANNNLGFKQ